MMILKFNFKHHADTIKTHSLTDGDGYRQKLTHKSMLKCINNVLRNKTFNGTLTFNFFMIHEPARHVVNFHSLTCV